MATRQRHLLQINLIQFRHNLLSSIVLVSYPDGANVTLDRVIFCRFATGVYPLSSLGWWREPTENGTVVR